MKGKHIKLLALIAVVIIGFFSIRSFMDSKANLQSWTFYTLDGKPVTLKDYEGKNIVLNLWALWCKPCLHELPLLEETRKKFGRDFVFIAASEDTPDKIRIFQETNDYGFTYLSSIKFGLKGILYLPQTYIVNKSGKVVKHYSGVIRSNPDKLADSLRIWTNE